MKAGFICSACVAMTLALAGCTTTGSSTEVTRFHTGEPIARGRIAIEPFDAAGGGPDVRGPEFDLYAGAIGQELAQLGWTLVDSAGEADQIALIALDEQRYTGQRSSPVSIGVGGGTGGWDSGVGAGVGFNLGGGPRELVTTTLNMRIKRRADDRVTWEGRATATGRADRPEGSPSALAPRLAYALFQGFPGETGRTVRVDLPQRP